MLMMVRRTHVSMFWLEGESKTHCLTAYDPNDSNQTKEVENYDTGKFDWGSRCHCGCERRL